MLRFYKPLTTTALALVLSTTSAYADLTAAEVWGDWRDYMQGMGYSVTANETASNGQLTIGGLSVEIPFDAEIGNMTMTMGGITFVENGDGTVDVQMAASQPVNITIAPPDQADPVKVAMTYTQSGHKMTARGTASSLTYDYTADNVSFSIDEMTAEGEILGPDQINIVIALADVVSKSTMTAGNMRNTVQTLTTGPMTLNMRVQPPGNEGNLFTYIGQVANMNYQGSGSIPLGISQVTDMQALMAAGFSFDGGFTFGAGSSDIKVTDKGLDSAITTSSDGGTLSGKMGNDGIDYRAVQTNVAVNAQMATVPFPVSFAMAKSGFNLAMPIAKSDTPQDFAFGFDMTNFTMADMIWGIFDPAGQLPRDPATLSMDLTGKVKLLVDFMNPEEMAMMETNGEIPGEINALTINSLIVDAVGARLTGNGDFVFDNTDMTTVPGMPKPVGAVNLNLSGGNGLLDKLVAMGFIGQEEVFGARMMMGMIAEAGDAPDTLKSNIEFTDEGQILANGQRLR